jgi:hypothetical protein
LRDWMDLPQERIQWHAPLYRLLSKQVPVIMKTKG